MLQQIILSFWQRRGYLHYLLLPLSWMYSAVIACRRMAYRWGILSTYQAKVPVIIVGNITVGGVGKTPLVIALTEFLQQQGYKPGIVSRGYGGKASHYPIGLSLSSLPQEVGDEPLLIHERTGCPVIVDPKRSRAAQSLLQHYECNIIISDDGLQHYALDRQLEISVVDGERRFGNEYCLPAGPLREPISRLKTVDLLVSQGKARGKEHEMQFEVGGLKNLNDPTQIKPLHALKGQTVHAVAGIGNPQRFFKVLQEAGLELIEHIFVDHHRYAADELVFADELPVIMTEKDAVKLKHLGLVTNNYWYLWGNAKLSDHFWQALMTKLKDHLS